MVLDTEHEKGKIKYQTHSHPQNNVVAARAGYQSEEILKRENQ